MTSDADLLRVPVGPGAVHVDRYGHGAGALILLHGFATYSVLWRNTAPRFSAAGFTSYAIDLLGYGQSDRPARADFGIAAQSQYLEHAMTALRVRRAVIVGLDVGAAVALRFASAHAQRVEKLILINPVGSEEIPGREIREMQRRTLRVVLRLSRGVMGAAPLLGPLLQRAVSNPDRMPAALQARYLAPYAGRDGVHHLLLLARSLRRKELEEIDLRSIKVPTLVIRGDLDPWLDSRVAERLVNAIPDSRLLRISNGARLIPEDEPVVLADHIVRFLSDREA